MRGLAPFVVLDASRHVCIYVIAAICSVLCGVLFAGPKRFSPKVEQVESTYKSAQDYYLQGINYDRCDVANIKDLITNADVPETLDAMRKNFKNQYDELPQWQSIYHNFRDGVLNEHSTPEERRTAVIGATFEYVNGILNPMSRLTWKYLDPSFPNVKFISKDKHKEVVYSKRTGRKIDSGINQGTANAAASLFDPEHQEDIRRFERCGTPSEAERHLANFLLRNQCVSVDHIKTLLDESNAGAKKRTARLFQSGDSDGSIDILKLESLLEEQIEFVKSLLAKGERATEGEIETYNSRHKVIRRDYLRIRDEITTASVSDEDKQNKLANVNKLVEQLKKLSNEVVSRKLVSIVSFDDLSRSEKGQSGNKSDKCVCPNPDYKATIPPAGPGWATCTKCGKSLGTILNGRFISTNPAVNGKSVK